MSAPVLPEDQIEVPAVVLPDRADAPISEITERFFRALLTKVPLDRIEEVHLFSPLRSGGVETGIAVIAAREIVVAPAIIDEPLPLPLEDAASAVDDMEPVIAERVAADDERTVELAMDADAIEAVDAAQDIAVDSGVDERAGSPYADEETTAEFDVAAGNDADHDGDDAALNDADVASGDIAPMHTEPNAELSAEPNAELNTDAIAPAVTLPVVRHTVYTARYRLVQKGPERGKWESNVVAEAEAPLITVETVVRGVQRRAGEDSETTRFTAAQLARALRIELTAGA